eukprot:TRINITY_DN2768_c0_g3_i1.p1 TRINITY_DN2768_c0_g3~~TRINITY_DN2768_c0_g3_i1.p1  ORF type:complete len:316 (-),score=74.70 TRINITY_DN2768_c0_g3_i1:108-1055(-)
MSDIQQIERTYSTLHESGNGKKFTMMQFNTLADGLGMDSFVMSPPESLAWSHRSTVILQLILTHQPDVITLQEVNHFHDFFLPELQRAGYDGLFHQKPDSPAVAFGAPPDGVAIFYKTSVFALDRSKMVQFLKEDGRPMNQTSIFAALHLIEDPALNVCVSVVHLKSKAAFEAVRVAQVTSLCQQLQEFIQLDSDHKEGELAKHWSVLVGGDFNSTPDRETYAYMQQASVLPASSLCSAYGLQGAASEPAFTTWKTRPNGDSCYCGDYIWFSQPHLRVLRRLDLPEAEKILPCRFPSFQNPSDHLPLVVEFEFTA